MQFNYRVTKYNPDYRNKKGHYLFQDEWTCYSQVGTKCGSKVLTLDKYFEVENNYIQSIILFMKCNRITTFKISGGLEKKWNPIKDPNSTKEMIYLFASIKDKDILKINQIKDLCRLALRNYVWCKLEYDETMFVHFYFDYYMYIGSKSECKKAVESIEESGLFVEEFESPYLEE